MDTKCIVFTCVIFQILWNTGFHINLGQGSMSFLHTLLIELVWILQHIVFEDLSGNIVSFYRGIYISDPGKLGLKFVVWLLDIKCFDGIGHMYYIVNLENSRYMNRYFYHQFQPPINLVHPTGWCSDNAWNWYLVWDLAILQRVFMLSFSPSR